MEAGSSNLLTPTKIREGFEHRGVVRNPRSFFRHSPLHGGIGHNALVPNDEPPSIDPAVDPSIDPSIDPAIHPPVRPLPEPPPPLTPRSPHQVAPAPERFVVDHDAVGTRPSRGLGALVVALYWTTAAAVVLAAAAVFHRRSVIDRIMNGDLGGRRPRALDHEARALIGLSSWLELGLGIASALATACWCRRVVGNARRAGIEGLHPNQAAIGWLIPLVWWYLGFEQLRTALTAVGDDARPLRRWQLAFTLATVFALLTRGNSARFHDLAELSTRLDHQGLLILSMAAILGVAAYSAGHVVRMFDRAFSPN